ncbi:TM2 domain-containing protein [uncultured Solobacterium sp.]|uniref:TM2 domain-containing protein n=1 Tax=uncultured Solobacterium sp. TaxID=747375 RepID=UPI0028DD26ED|nr:TM2 domain-containing protein [uncultured Solobacterium sp.]
MDKIVRIENRIVSVGKADGSLEEFDIAYFNFPPRIGDYVNIYRNDDSIIITKAESVFDNRSSSRGVNKITYALLAFFLGDFGAQEFYAGNTRAGVLSLVFFWTGIPAIYGIYKFIIALSKPADENGYIEM